MQQHSTYKYHITYWPDVYVMLADFWSWCAIKNPHFSTHAHNFGGSLMSAVLAIYDIPKSAWMHLKHHVTGWIMLTL